jgi:hypothetical protein
MAEACVRETPSPLLFILAIDPLNHLLQVATDRGLLSPLNSWTTRFRVSMYADDAVIFIKPSVDDVNNLTELLSNFGLVTGLQTNLQKTTVSAISCDEINLASILGGLPVARAHFPIKYLGLPLSPRRLRKVEFQPQIDKAASKLSVWYGRNLTQAGRVCLTKSILSSQPVYLLTVVKPPKEVLDDIDKIRRCFLWVGDKALSGGKCKVNWTSTTLPNEYGGLGVLNLNKFATALRVRWLWHEWTSPDKTWVGMEVPCTEKDKTPLRSLHHDHTWRRTKGSFLELRLANWTTTERPDTASICEDTTQKANCSGGPAGQHLDQGSQPPGGFHYNASPATS